MMMMAQVRYAEPAAEPARRGGRDEAREGGRSLVVDDWQVHRARATVLLRVVGRGDARVAHDRLQDTMTDM